MKRVRLSGAAYRRKRSLRSEEMKRNQGALLKFLTSDKGTDQQPEPPSSAGMEIEDSFVESFSDKAGAETIRDLGNSQNETAPEAASQQLETLATASGSEAESDLEKNRNCPLDFLASERQLEMSDIGLWPDRIDQELRVQLIKRGPAVIQHMDFEFDSVERQGNSRGTMRTLSREWFFRTLANGEKNLRSWMIYSPSKSSIFCFCCKLFPHADSKLNSKEGFSKWWRLSDKIPEHENGAPHNRAFIEWMELDLRLREGKTIDVTEQRRVEKKIERWKLILHRVLNIVKFLAKQNLAFRGHREQIAYYDQDDYDPKGLANRGNFLELVHLIAKYDPILHEHLMNVSRKNKVKCSYLSPKIQDEFIELMGNHVRRAVLNQVRKSKYYAIMFDSTPDVSHKEQTSQVIRYVVLQDRTVEIVESFIDFVETKEKNAEAYTELILGKLQEDGLDIMDCRGQTYDNAAVMSGRINGVQQRIKDINPKADFISCSNHSLNLAGVHATSSTIHSITFYGVLEKVFVFFASSTHRWDILSSCMGKVKRNSATRWSARAEAVGAFKNNYIEITTALKHLTDDGENRDTRCDAAVLLNSIQCFSFPCFLYFWSSILKEMNDTQIYLQRQELNVDLCVLKLQALRENLASIGEELVCQSIEFANSICELLGIVEQRPFRVRKPGKYGETSRIPEKSHADRMRTDMRSSLERLKQEIDRRFEVLRRFSKKYGFLQPRILLDSTSEVEIDEQHTDFDSTEFMTERRRLRAFVAAANMTSELREGSPFNILAFIQKFNLGVSMPNIVIALRVFLTIGISVASCERSFSKLKLIKNYLRSTLSSKKLNNLAVLSIENRHLEDLDADEIIAEFVDRKIRRMSRIP